MGVSETSSSSSITTGYKLGSHWRGSMKKGVCEKIQWVLQDPRVDNNIE